MPDAMLTILTLPLRPHAPCESDLSSDSTAGYSSHFALAYFSGIGLSAKFTNSTLSLYLFAL